MEEPIVFDPPSSSNCNFNDIFPGDGGGGDADHQEIPHIDFAMLNDLPLPENFNFGSGSDAEIDFSIDDLDFVDELLFDPFPKSDSASPVRKSPPHQPTADLNFNSMSDSPDVKVSDQDFVKSGLIVDRPVVHDAEYAISERDSSGRVSSQDSGILRSNYEEKLEYRSPELPSGDQFSSHGSGVSPTENPPSPDSCQSSRQFSRIPKIIAEEGGNKPNPKRKKEQRDEGSSETRTSKCMKPSVASKSPGADLSAGNEEEDDKKKARLMRNRESAQLSRQRRKQYVDELEEKVKSMHATITDLHSKISYVAAENATLRQQLSGGGLCPPPPPGMYPVAPMGYPWMPYPPYVVKPQGSQVPLVPIPRLKPNRPASTPKASKKPEKSENKKNVGKAKKVASISFVGLVFFMLFFGCLVPILNVKYGGDEGRLGVVDMFRKTQNGRLLMVDGEVNETSHVVGGSYSGRTCGVYKDKLCGRDMGHKEHSSRFKNETDGSVHMSNSSEHLAASLFVPRNDKLVKIDGNLIIHSVLASEKAKVSTGKVQTKVSEETRLAVARSNVPAYHISGSGRSNKRGSNLDDGKLQQWFLDDLSGSMLSSGMCTEVFQFDVTPAPGSIIPAASMTNSTSNHPRNNSRIPRNRRINPGQLVPLNPHPLNVTDSHFMPNTEKDHLQMNKSSSSMVVSVLVDPKEASDADSEGVIQSKPLPRIFVVVLIDSVKYVTYSCMLPLMGSSPHLVTT